MRRFIQVVNRFGYRRVLVATTLGLSLVHPVVYDYRSAGLVLQVLPFVLFLQGMVNSTRFSSMNTLTLERSPGQPDEQRQRAFAVNGWCNCR